MRHDMDPLLIQSVSRDPRLYDKSIGSVSTQSRRDAWMAVAQECGTPVDQCQARWKSLRDRYVREINKPSSKGFALFENLNFLREHIKLRRKCPSNASDQQTPSYYIDDITQDEAPLGSLMLMECPLTQDQEQQEYLSENADTSSVEFVAEESIVENEFPTDHTLPPAAVSLPASNQNPAMEHLSAFAKVISMLETALKEKSEPAEPQDPFYKYLESMLSRVDEGTRGDIQLQLLNLAHEQIKKATKP